MALKKSVEYRGVVCNYHKIVEIEVEFFTQPPDVAAYSTLTATVGLFVDAAQRDSDVSRALRLKQYHFQKSDQHSPADEKIDKVYKALKFLPEFVGAEDV
jgi:hypothetical protein